MHRRLLSADDAAPHAAPDLRLALALIAPAAFLAGMRAQKDLPEPPSTPACCSAVTS